MKRENRDILKLKETDLWSLVLFTLYKAMEIPELSSLSEMIYLLPKDSLIALCEYYGGMTIRIPSVDELETLLHTIKLYKDINIDKRDKDEVISNMGVCGKTKDKILEQYSKVVKVLETYNFKQRV